MLERLLEKLGIFLIFIAASCWNCKPTCVLSTKQILFKEYSLVATHNVFCNVNWL